MREVAEKRYLKLFKLLNESIVRKYRSAETLIIVKSPYLFGMKIRNPLYSGTSSSTFPLTRDMSAHYIII